MTSATTESKRYRADASNYTSSTFPTLPTEIVRLVFETSVTPGLRPGDEQQRQRTAYASCLVSKDVKAWVEPLLYEKVVLESQEQVTNFLMALKIKPATFLSRTVKTVWILSEYLAHDTADRLPILFNKCPLLKRFTIYANWNDIQLLRNIPKPRSRPFMLQELTIIKASLATEMSLDIPHLDIQKLHLIGCSTAFFDTLFRCAREDKVLLDKLRAIPEIYIDFIPIGSVKLRYSLKYSVIPLWFSPSTDSISVLHIRASSETPEQSTHSLASNMGADCDFRYREQFLYDMHSWIKYFEVDVQECGGRLVVRALSDVEVGSNFKSRYIKRCMAACFDLD